MMNVADVESDFHSSLDYFERHRDPPNEKTFYTQQSSCRNPFDIVVREKLQLFCLVSLVTVFAVRNLSHPSLRNRRRADSEEVRPERAKGGIKHKTL